MPIALDLDFSDIRAYPVGSHYGIWVLRPARQIFSSIVALTEAGIRLSAVEQTDRRLWIIGERKVEIRE